MGSDCCVYLSQLYASILLTLYAFGVTSSNTNLLMGNCVSICKECKSGRFTRKSKKCGTKISDLPDELLELIFLCLSIESWHSSIRRVCSRWNRLVNRICKTVDALCFDGNKVQISFCVNRINGKRPPFIKRWVKMDSLEEELLFLRLLYTHRVEAALTPKIKGKTVETYSYCRYVASISASGFSPFYIVTIPSLKQKHATAFCHFLVNRAVNVKHLHFNFSTTTTTPTKHFYKKLLRTVAQKCKNVESLHVNGTFFQTMPFANSIFCSMLPNLQNLIELVVLDDIEANQQLDVVSSSLRDFVEMMVTSCQKIRKLEMGHLKLTDETGIEMFLVLKLQRLAFSASNTLLDANWTRSFSTMTELKFLTIMLSEYEQFIREGLQFIASMPNLQSLSLGFQNENTYCMHAGYVARVLSQGFVALKNLFLESLRFDQLTQPYFNSNTTGKFLDNLAPKLEVLSLTVLDDFGPYTDCLSKPMQNLKILYLEGKYIQSTFKLASMVVQFCPRLSQLHFSNRSSSNFFKFIRKMYKWLHVHHDEKCSKLNDGDGVRGSAAVLKIVTHMSMTIDKKKDVKAAMKERKCGLRIYKTEDACYVALINRT